MKFIPHRSARDVKVMTHQAPALSECNDGLFIPKEELHNWRRAVRAAVVSMRKDGCSQYEVWKLLNALANRAIHPAAVIEVFHGREDVLAPIPTAAPAGTIQHE